MTHKKLNRMMAAVVFLVSATIYFMTLSPTVVFWDVGEFIAAAFMMQVPHPPGSPLFLLLARVAMMIPFAADLAVRAHALSAILSSFAIMFLYLVIVKILIRFRGIPLTLVDKLAVYGSAVIGSLSLAFGTTYWDNSIEAEVYGASMFFLSAIIWLVMRWQERSEVPGNEKYILIIAYLIGLSLGVHLLALLAIFPVLMVVYFKRYEFSWNSFMKFGVISVIVFGVVYPGIVKYLPGMMDGDFGGMKNDFIKWMPWLLIASACWGVYYSYVHKKKMLNIALLSVVLIFLGYTTYTEVLIRANTNVPMNENDPSNLARLTSYLGREQYGDAPFFQRRYSQEPQHRGIYTNYSSDMDFLIRYQLNHMFFRYLGWNYIGQESDEHGLDFQDAGVDWGDTLGIPFLLGLLGLYYHFKKDWKMGLVFLAMFIIMGPILALYQNQQEPQPRERDYFYVGAFFVFSLWVAIGVAALIDYLKEYIESKQAVSLFSVAVVLLFTFAVPVNQIRLNYHSHDRSGNYVAWDYSYNILQTCAQDAILFTNGDNDTFPLWYLQDVEGVRRDVRIVNLSLINTSWYIKEMKEKSYYPEAKPVPISLSDAQIARILPIAWEPKKMDLPVPKSAYEEFGVTADSVVNRGKITFTMPNTLQYGNTKAIRVQDILVRDIIFTNKWKLPVYFAVTCAPDSKIGLDDYLWFDGLAMRLEPVTVPDDNRRVNIDILQANLLNEPEGYSKTPQYGYKFRNVANPDVYFDENITRLMMNYRSAFIRLALFYANVSNENDKAVAALNRMETLIPSSKVPMGWELTSDLASFYRRFGKEDKYRDLMERIEPQLRDLIASGQANLSSYYNPYRVLLEYYDAEKNYPRSLQLLQSLDELYPNNADIKQRIASTQALIAQKGQSSVNQADSIGKN